MSHESDSASRHRNMLKSLRVDIPQLDSCDSLDGARYATEQAAQIDTAADPSRGETPTD
jgi:hypothetical protein